MKYLRKGYQWCVVRGHEAVVLRPRAHLAMFYGQLSTTWLAPILELPSAYEYTRSLTGAVSKSKLHWVTDVLMISRDLYTAEPYRRRGR